MALPAAACTSAAATRRSYTPSASDPPTTGGPANESVHVRPSADGPDEVAVNVRPWPASLAGPGRTVPRDRVWLPAPTATDWSGMDASVGGSFTARTATFTVPSALAPHRSAAVYVNDAGPK